jgi:hypothetical protein
VEPRTRLNTCVRAIDWLIDSVLLPLIVINKNKNERPVGMVFILSGRFAGTTCFSSEFIITFTKLFFQYF